MYIQTSVSTAANKQLDEGIFHRFPRSNEDKLHARLIGPSFERPRLEFCPMIHRAGPWA